MYLTNHTFLSPVFVVSNVLLFASPPALTLAQVSISLISAFRYHLCSSLIIVDHTSGFWRRVRASYQSNHLLVLLRGHSTLHHHFRRHRSDPLKALIQRAHSGTAQRTILTSCTITQYIPLVCSILHISAFCFEIPVSSNDITSSLRCSVSTGFTQFALCFSWFVPASESYRRSTCVSA